MRMIIAVLIALNPLHREVWVVKVCPKLSSSFAQGFLNLTHERTTRLFFTYAYVLVEAVRSGMVVQGVQPPYGAAVSAL